MREIKAASGENVCADASGWQGIHRSRHGRHFQGILFGGFIGKEAGKSRRKEDRQAADVFD
jgi:hypothetical protein